MTNAYRTYFGLTQDESLVCENCGKAYKVKVILINPNKEAEIGNMIVLCRGCIKAIEMGIISASDLNYIHILKLNAHERSLK